ncbi:hypothetical protein CRENBAI_005771, partial [Crenichthys baileyi]
RRCFKHWMTHINSVPRDPTETPRNTATPLTSAGRRRRLLQYALQGMQRGDVHPVKPGEGAWRRPGSSFTNGLQRHPGHGSPRGGEAPSGVTSHTARQGLILQGVSHRDHLHNPTCQPLSRKGLTLPRANITSKETVSPTNGRRGADIRLKCSDRAKRLRGGTRIKSEKPERQDTASHWGHLWHKRSISPQRNTGAIRVPPTTWVKHRQSMQFPHPFGRNHSQQEGGFQGESLEVRPRNGLERGRLKGRKHQRQIPRRGHRAPGRTQAPATLQKQRDIPCRPTVQPPKPNMPTGNGCHIHLQGGKGSPQQLLKEEHQMGNR